MTTVVAGLGSGLAILVLALLHDVTQVMTLIPAFGATCALVFAVPDSPFSRPMNVIGGHIVSSVTGLAVLALAGHTPLSMAIGVGLAISLMHATRTMHPPAGGNPLIVIATAPSVTFLFTPILAGTVAIISIGFVYRRLVGRLRDTNAAAG